MSTPKIVYYACMEVATNTGRRTPKYTIKSQAGFYPPMEKLRGKDGQISMYLMPQSREDNSSTPPMKLQAKNSLNFTGLKDYWIDGKMSGFAYGYPYRMPWHSSKITPNPFYDNREDGFLFIIHQEQDSPTPLPTKIELIVLEGAKVLIGAYCKQLEMGGFDDELAALREQAMKG